jgi:hypothetical protein
MLALFGASSGPVPPFDLIQLSGKGSLFVTRPTLWHYIATRAELEWRAGDVLGWAARANSSCAPSTCIRWPKRRRRRPTWKPARRRGRFAGAVKAGRASVVSLDPGQLRVPSLRSCEAPAGADHEIALH